jgi:uncharacterized protein
MIRRLRVNLPPGRPAGQPSLVRLLAVSDEHDPALDEAGNRQALGKVDAVLGCGDLEPDRLGFLADAFHAPLLLVRGNHDRGGAWEAGERHVPVELDGRVEVIAGLPVTGLSWPGPAQGRPVRTEAGAWRQALAALLRARFRGPRPEIILSHVPPLGHGDVVGDPFHTGFRAYHWLCRRLQPALWLHGHTPTAAGPAWRTSLGRTTLVNVTGAVLVELSRGEGIPSGDGPGRSNLEERVS